MTTGVSIVNLFSFLIYSLVTFGFRWPDNLLYIILIVTSLAAMKTGGELGEVSSARASTAVEVVSSTRLA